MALSDFPEVYPCGPCRVPQRVPATVVCQEDEIMFGICPRRDVILTVRERLRTGVEDIERGWDPYKNLLLPPDDSAGPSDL